MRSITDNNGEELRVTNLKKALHQAKEFKEYRATDSRHEEMVRRQSAYWRDVYRKLLLLYRHSRKIKAKGHGNSN